MLEYQTDVDAQETDADMARSLFCVAAPGATQDTTRLFKAILKGCIPITFFRCVPVSMNLQTCMHLLLSGQTGE
jgi:hypothetical protein